MPIWAVLLLEGAQVAREQWHPAAELVPVAAEPEERLVACPAPPECPAVPPPWLFWGGGLLPSAIQLIGHGCWRCRRRAVAPRRRGGGVVE